MSDTTNLNDQMLSAINLLQESQEWKNFKEALIKWAKTFWEKIKDAMIKVVQAFKKLIMLNKAYKENPKLAKLARSKKNRVAKKNIRRLWKIAERGSRA